jgi:hypothetical protein
MSLRSPVNVYIGGTSGNDGWDFEGGSNIGVLDVTTTTPGTTKHVLAVKNSTFKYGGGVVDTTARSVSVESWQGLAFFQNCRADAAQTDGWNFHNLYAAASMNVVTLNCTADDNGRFPQTSCNSHTAHENVRVIDIAGYFRESHGASIRYIDTVKGLLLETWVDGDHGDIPHGGVVPPTAFRADGSAQIWCDRTKATMPGGSYAYMTGNGTAAIHKRNAWPTPAPDSGPGTYDTY